MRPAFACAALAVLALSACKPAGEAPAQPGGEAPAPDAGAPPAPIEPRLNGVDLTEDLRVVGTEPFWSIDIDNDYLKFKGVDLPEATGQNAGPTMTPGTATWNVSTGDGTVLKVVLTGEKCSDGMSDREYPLTAKVDFGEKHFNGCAATVAALDQSPRP
ncbi:MAG: hypothetical protein K1X35_08600 [Caulobacteraceae bacterium]|nr:hypothetical protein [Caulobacteraceae bacterium]